MRQSRSGKRHGLHVATVVFIVLLASLGTITIGTRLGNAERDARIDDPTAPVGTHLAFQGDNQLDPATEAPADDAPPAGVPSDNAPSVTAKSVFAMDASTGDTLYALDADEPRDIGSTVKIVTALVVVDHLDLDTGVTIEDSDLVDPDVYSNMGLVPGDTLSGRQLLQGMLIPSGSDGANALARTVGGILDPDAHDPETVFVDAMNDKAAELGMTDTVFANPHGNDAAGAHSTAHDLAIGARALLDNPDLADIVAMPSYDFISIGPEARPYNGLSTNKFLTAGDPGILGVKSGSTEEAGGCLVLAFTRDGSNPVILVTLGSDLTYDGDWISQDARWDDAAVLKAWLEG